MSPLRPVSVASSPSATFVGPASLAAAEAVGVAFVAPPPRGRRSSPLPAAGQRQGRQGRDRAEHRPRVRPQLVHRATLLSGGGLDEALEVALRRASSPAVKTCGSRSISPGSEPRVRAESRRREPRVAPPSAPARRTGPAGRGPSPAVPSRGPVPARAATPRLTSPASGTGGRHGHRRPGRESTHARPPDRPLARLLLVRARFGIAARGVVYIVIGVLAVQLALGDGGKATDQQGALHTIAKQPFGTVLLLAVAIGLAGYASWRLLRAALGGTQGADDAQGPHRRRRQRDQLRDPLRRGGEDPRRLRRRAARTPTRPPAACSAGPAARGSSASRA